MITGLVYVHAFAVTRPASWNRQQQSSHLTLCRISEEPTESPLFLTDYLLFFSIHLERGRP